MILINLLSNAYKFTAAWGKVDIEIYETEKYLHISIRDTGSGISEKMLPHIFEKFNQSNNTNYTKKSIRWTGLGLNLSKQVIEMLGGTLGVSSKEWIGSCFEFTLPL
jgi:signal transduction histidine kinase